MSHRFTPHGPLTVRVDTESDLSINRTKLLVPARQRQELPTFDMNDTFAVSFIGEMARSERRQTKVAGEETASRRLINRDMPANDPMNADGRLIITNGSSNLAG